MIGPEPRDRDKGSAPCAVRGRENAATRRRFCLWDAESVPVRASAQQEGALFLRLPERVTRANSRPMRVVFAAEVFDLATSFVTQS